MRFNELCKLWNAITKYTYQPISVDILNLN